MKFISKIANLNMILKPGIPSSAITGTPEIPTLFVRFRDGIVDVSDEALIGMMLKHEALGTDFIKAEGDEPDPYAHMRTPSEPAHTMTEIKFGTPVKRTETPVTPGVMPPEIRKMIADQAKDIAMSLLPGMVAEALALAAAAVKEDTPVAPTPPSEVKTSKPKTK